MLLEMNMLILRHYLLYKFKTGMICFKKRDGKCIKDTDNPSDGTGTSLALAIIIISARSKHFIPSRPLLAPSGALIAIPTY